MSDDLPRGEEVDLERPSAARVYDYLLGGTTNWAIDRLLGDRIIAANPDARHGAKTNREFLGRAVRECVRGGVTQFLDIGSGIPSAGNVHEVADELDTSSHVVYVDYEPVAVAHARVMLEDHGDPARHAIVQARMENVDEVWQQAVNTGVLDPTRPVALIMAALLHVIPDPVAQEAMQRYRSLLPSGSYLVISHASQDGVSEETRERLAKIVQQGHQTSTPMEARDRAAVTALFGEFELQDPGVVWIPEWRIDAAPSPYTRQNFSADPSSVCILGGMAIKR
ncbi:methyltransferase [Amycolatopsis acidicola]|uniref:Methyltransferase n=1 Tax=Amycolatopsis acidicola TaxID=2596893 RepID=A0A5N0V7Y6_9PSEU|nr:SAM-dependent methyltransferase [Amycolatopsis acidicola]KAA9161588.1 methyltransferase [Amycolatopsis acidicola]